MSQQLLTLDNYIDYIQLFSTVHCFNLETKQARFMYKSIRHVADLSFKLYTLELEKKVT